jgi:hypothetical protein
LCGPAIRPYAPVRVEAVSGITQPAPVPPVVAGSAGKFVLAGVAGHGAHRARLGRQVHNWV